jgi:hypothetical protein
MKTCPKCKEDKEEALFSKNKNRKNGLGSYCKECRNNYSKQLRIERPGIDKEYSRKWEAKHPTSAKAHMFLSRKIKVGIIVKPDKCSICGEKNYLVGHHPYYNYTNPLDVQWVCRSCHKYVHKQENIMIVKRGTI